MLADRGLMERQHEGMMDDQVKVRTAAEARLKEETAAARTELFDLVSVTKENLERADAVQSAGAFSRSRAVLTFLVSRSV